MINLNRYEFCKQLAEIRELKGFIDFGNLRHGHTTVFIKCFERGCKDFSMKSTYDYLEKYKIALILEDIYVDSYIYLHEFLIKRYGRSIKSNPKLSDIYPKIKERNITIDEFLNICNTLNIQIKVIDAEQCGPDVVKISQKDKKRDDVLDKVFNFLESIILIPIFYLYCHLVSYVVFSIETETLVGGVLWAISSLFLSYGFVMFALFIGGMIGYIVIEIFKLLHFRLQKWLN